MADVNVYSQHKGRGRIGPISVFTLVIIVCLAVLSMLAFSTATASNTMAQRQASLAAGVYENETAAQEFLAGVDGVLATRGVGSVEPSLSSIIEAAEAAADGRVRATADISDGVVHAEFVNEENRMLSVVLTIRSNNTYRIDAWNVVAVQNEEQPRGGLLILD